jgi:sensor domain CHASE-containing protein
MDIMFFLSGQGSIHYHKLSDQKPLCPISNALMYNIAKNTKSAWTWT